AFSAPCRRGRIGTAFVPSSLFRLFDRQSLSQSTGISASSRDSQQQLALAPQSALANPAFEPRPVVAQAARSQEVKSPRSSSCRPTYGPPGKICGSLATTRRDERWSSPTVDTSALTITCHT